MNSKPAFACSKSKMETTISINEICSKLKIKIPDVYLVNFEMIPHVVLVLPLSTLNKHVPAG